MNGAFYGRRPTRPMRPGNWNRPGWNYRPGNWNRPGPLFSFGVPFLLGATTATLLNPYYQPYPYYYPYYY